MRGELDFEESLRGGCALLAGLTGASSRGRARRSGSPPARARSSAPSNASATSARIVSGGFTQFTDHLVAELGIDYARGQRPRNRRRPAHRSGGRPVVDREARPRALERFAAEGGCRSSQTVAIGDGANDLDMLAAAGLGIAFNAKPVVRAQADTSV